jgi:hypothetical protein
VRFRLPLRFNPLGRPGGPHPSVCGASAVVLVIITARRSGSPVRRRSRRWAVACNFSG